MTDLDDLLKKNPVAGKELNEIQRKLSELGGVSDISLESKRYRLDHPFDGERMIPAQRSKESEQDDLITYCR